MEKERQEDRGRSEDNLPEKHSKITWPSQNLMWEIKNFQRYLKLQSSTLSDRWLFSPKLSTISQVPLINFVTPVAVITQTFNDISSSIVWQSWSMELEISLKVWMKTATVVTKLINGTWDIVESLGENSHRSDKVDEWNLRYRWKFRWKQPPVCQSWWMELEISLKVFDFSHKILTGPSNFGVFFWEVQELKCNTSIPMRCPATLCLPHIWL